MIKKNRKMMIKEYMIALEENLIWRHRMKGCVMTEEVWSWTVSFWWCFGNWKFWNLHII